MSNVFENCNSWGKIIGIAFYELTDAVKESNKSLTEVNKSIEGLKAKPKFKKEHPFKKFM